MEDHLNVNDAFEDVKQDELDEANQNIESAIKVNDIEFVPIVSESVETYGKYGASQIAGDDHYKDE